MAKHSPRFLKLSEDARAQVREMTIDELRARQKAGDAPLVLDVREDNEWAKGHVEGAEHLGRGVLERDIEQKVPDTGTEMVLYCGGGYRSALAAESLQKMGYTNVWSLAGGWRGWTEAGHPTQS
jgi:rhodanese-related sulfurtransferase